MRMMRLSAALVAVLGAAACDLDLNDPNLPPQDVVFADVEGMKALGVGLQAEWGNQMGWAITSTGLVADEIGAGTAAFENYRNADSGAALDAATGLSADPWSGMYRVVKLANDLIDNVPDVPMAAGTESGLLALAKLYKAMAYGTLLTLFEQITLEGGSLENPSPTFVTRQVALTEALRLLNEARAHVTSQAPSAEFTSQVLQPGLDLANTIDAMIARYSLMAGSYAEAAAAAQRVTAASEFRFASGDVNHVRTIMYLSGNAFQMRPEQNLRLEAEAGDQRVAFWVRAAAVGGGDGPMDELNRYTTNDAAFPVYTLDEMKLIRAEAAARTNDLATARTLINEVRTQCAAAGAIVTEPMPCLPALPEEQLDTQAEVLAEILKQRRYELFLMGLRYEDLRRFGQPLKYTWIPYPSTECQRNSNAPQGGSVWMCP